MVLIQGTAGPHGKTVFGVADSIGPVGSRDYKDIHCLEKDTRMFISLLSIFGYCLQFQLDSKANIFKYLWINHVDGPISTEKTGYLRWGPFMESD